MIFSYFKWVVLSRLHNVATRETLSPNPYRLWMLSDFLGELLGPLSLFFEQRVPSLPQEEPELDLVQSKFANTRTRTGQAMA